LVLPSPALAGEERVRVFPELHFRTIQGDSAEFGKELEEFTAETRRIAKFGNVRKPCLPRRGTIE
jgi:hypothetical protein